MPSAVPQLLAPFLSLLEALDAERPRPQSHDLEATCFFFGWGRMKTNETSTPTQTIVTPFCRGDDEILQLVFISHGVWMVGVGYP